MSPISKLLQQNILTSGYEINTLVWLTHNENWNSQEQDFAA